MAALTTLFPVFFMLGLGLFSRIRGWISSDQKAGAYNIVIKLLFPILIFNLIFTTKFEFSHLSIAGYVAAAYIGCIAVGKLAAGFTGKKYAHISPYLLATNEGGNIALPLYLSIVGASSNTIIFDLGGSFTCFILMPVLVARQSAAGAGWKELLTSMLTNSFIAAVLLGLVLNLTGVCTLLENSAFYDLYAGTVSLATAPIIGIILFSLGYDLQIDRKTLPSISRLIVVKVILSAAIIAGFFVLFPSLMADKIFMTAVLIYFSCPTGFGVPPIISPLFKSQDDSAYASSFISIYMIITLTVYTLAVIFLG